MLTVLEMTLRNLLSQAGVPETEIGTPADVPAKMRAKEAYGEGTALPGKAPEYVWRGSKVTLHFRQDPVTGLGMIGYTSTAIDELVKRAAPEPDALPANASVD